MSTKTITQLFNEGQPEPRALPYLNKPSGVEGWLQWLVLSLFLISPAASAWLVYSSTAPLQAQFNADRYASVLHIYWGTRPRATLRRQQKGWGYELHMCASRASDRALDRFVCSVCRAANTSSER